MQEDGEIRIAAVAAPPPEREPALSDLRFAGQLALWALRQGRGLLAGDEATRRLLAEALAVAEVPRALDPLETFVRVMAAGACRPVELRAPPTRCLGRDEALILRALAACQSGQADLAQGLLEAMLAPAAARAGRAALSAVGQAFALQGLRLADTECGRLRALEPLFGRSPLTAPGLARLH